MPSASARDASSSSVSAAWRAAGVCLQWQQSNAPCEMRTVRRFGPSFSGGRASAACIAVQHLVQAANLHRKEVATRIRIGALLECRTTKTVLLLTRYSRLDKAQGSVATVAFL